MTMDITIYGRKSCTQCAATVRKTKALGLPYQYVDLDQDDDAACRLAGEGHRSLPVVFAGSQHWAGFRPDLLDGLVK